MSLDHRIVMPPAEEFQGLSPEELPKGLEGLVVVELGDYVAMPACTRALGEMGATVYKIETIKGNLHRGDGVGFGMPELGPDNPAFDMSNANKKFLSIDMKSDGGRELVEKLLEQADETQAQEYTKVTGLELLEPEQGAQAQTTPENQAQLDGLTAMTTALASCGLMEGMTSIDVSSKTEIVMVYDGRLTVKVLNNVDFDRKLKALKQVIAVIGEEGRGTINMKGQDKIIWSKEN